MNVVIVCDGPVPHEHMNYRGEALIRLPPQGHHLLSVVAPRSEGRLPALLEDKLLRYPYGRYRPVKGFGSIPLRLLRVTAMYRRTRNAIRPGTEVIRTISTLPTAVAIVARGKRPVPVVANVSDFYSDLYAANRLPMRRLANRSIIAFERLCLRAECLIVDSEAQRTRWISRGAHPHQCVVIPHGLPRSWYSHSSQDSPISARPRKANRIFYVGDISEMDGVDLLLRALHRLVRDVPTISLVVVGGGTNRYISYLRRLAQSLSIQGHIEWIASVPNAHLPRLIDASDVCVAPFRLWETSATSIPNKVLEYLTRFKPIVVPRGSTLESLFGPAFIYFTPDDPVSLAYALRDGLNRVDAAEEPPMRRLIQKQLNWGRVMELEWRLIEAVTRQSIQDFRKYDFQLGLDDSPRPSVVA